VFRRLQSRRDEWPKRKVADNLSSAVALKRPRGVFQSPGANLLPGALTSGLLTDSETVSYGHLILSPYNFC